MRKSVLFVISLAFVLAPLGFGGTMCTPGTPSDGFATGSCDFYHTAASYPFDLTAFLTDNGTISLAPNYQIPAYIVFTTDSTEVTNQLYDPIGDPTQADWKDVLFFVNNVVPVPSDPTQDLSTEAILYWGASLPSGSTVDNFLGGGYGVYILANGSGNYSWDVGVDPSNANARLDFNVHDSSSPVPEPSTLVTMGAAVLGLWSVRRRRA